MFSEKWKKIIRHIFLPHPRLRDRYRERQKELKRCRKGWDAVECCLPRIAAMNILRTAATTCKDPPDQAC